MSVMHPDPIRSAEFYSSVPSKRLIAWILDSVAALVLTVIAIPFTAFVGLFFFPFMWLMVGFAYRVLSITAWSGTPGMRMMSIELRDAEGQRLNFAQSFLHTLGYTLSIGTLAVQFVSVVCMAGSAKGQGLTDMVLGTVMINRR